MTRQSTGLSNGVQRPAWHMIWRAISASQLLCYVAKELPYDRHFSTPFVFDKYAKEGGECVMALRQQRPNRVQRTPLGGGNAHFWELKGDRFPARCTSPA